jgi:rubrerythrin
MTRPFGSLSAQEVLSLAINVECANAERFRSFATVFGGYDKRVAARFEELAAEEDGHEAILRQRYEARFGTEVLPIQESDVSGVIETFDLDDGEHQVLDTMTPRKVYELTLAAEQYAHTFYERALEQTEDPELAALYRELCELEEGHEGWVEEKLARLDELEK